MSTSADRREENSMNEAIITATRSTTAPRYEITAAGLLAECRRFYQDPENEKAYQEWKKSRKEVTSE